MITTNADEHYLTSTRSQPGGENGIAIVVDLKRGVGNVAALTAFEDDGAIPLQRDLEATAFRAIRMTKTSMTISQTP
jgi:hypothetical protein